MTGLAVGFTQYYGHITYADNGMASGCVIKLVMIFLVAVAI